MGGEADKTDEELEVRASRVKNRKGFAGKVADLFDPGTRKDATAAEEEIRRRKAAQPPAQPASAPKELQFKKGGAVKGWGKARGGKAAKIG